MELLCKTAIERAWSCGLRLRNGLSAARVGDGLKGVGLSFGLDRHS